MKTTFTEKEILDYLINRGEQVVAKMNEEHNYEEGIKLNTELMTINELISELAKAAVKGE